MDEVRSLAERYGVPLEREYEIRADNLFGPINRMDRRGEVIFVLRRPGGKVLLSTKSFYLPGIYRLPSGGIGPDEPIEDALLREVAEETGLQARVTRFLAILRYKVHVGRITAPFISYVFELDASEGDLRLDEEESITEFIEVDPSELPEYACRLRNLPPDRRPWGEFRAPAHDVVAELLAQRPLPR